MKLSFFVLQFLSLFISLLLFATEKWDDLPFFARINRSFLWEQKSRHCNVTCLIRFHVSRERSIVIAQA